MCVGCGYWLGGRNVVCSGVFSLRWSCAWWGLCIFGFWVCDHPHAKKLYISPPHACVDVAWLGSFPFSPGTDPTPQTQPNPTQKIDELDQLLVAVGLVRPNRDVFKDEIKVRFYVVHIYIYIYVYGCATTDDVHIDVNTRTPPTSPLHLTPTQTPPKNSTSSWPARPRPSRSSPCGSRTARRRVAPKSAAPPSGAPFFGGGGGAGPLLLGVFGCFYMCRVVGGLGFSDRTHYTIPLSHQGMASTDRRRHPLLI